MLDPDDILIDGGNSYYTDDIRRAGQLKAKQIHYVDVGTSGGVWGLDRGYCMMIGGEPNRRTPGSDLRRPRPGIAAARAIDRENAAPAGGAGARAEQAISTAAPGAGHFVKMVHNGIEYGLMAAYAEGLTSLNTPTSANPNASRCRDHAAADPEFYQYDFHLADVAEVWRRGSVIASWLLDLTATALLKSPSLTNSRAASPTPAKAAGPSRPPSTNPSPPRCSPRPFERFSSRGEADFADRLLSAMRFEFGGHIEKKRRSDAVRCRPHDSVFAFE